MSARGAARRPGHRSNSSFNAAVKSADGSYDDDSRAEQAQFIEDLKQQVQRAELASEQYQKELDILQMRLSEVVGERNDLEDQISQRTNDAEATQADSLEIMRQKHELQLAHDKEKNKMLEERDDQSKREQELQAIIQRLNETIKHKDIRAHVDRDRPGLSRSSM